MVTKQEDALSPAAEPEPQSESEGALDIEDNTPPEVLAQERAFLEGREVEDEGVVEEEGEGAPAAAVEGIEQPVPPVPEPAAPPQPVAPPPRAYTQDEWAKRESAFNRMQAEQERRLQENERRDLERNVETEVEATVRVLRERLEPTMGADEAHRVAEANRTEIRTNVQTRQDNERLRAENQALRVQSTQSTLRGWANELQSSLGLTKEQMAPVVDLANVAASAQPFSPEFMRAGELMEQAARREAARSQQAQQQEKQRRARVPAGGPSQQLESAESTVAPTTEDTVASSAMQKPAWQWTPEESAVMKRRAGL